MLHPFALVRKPRCLCNRAHLRDSAISRKRSNVWSRSKYLRKQAGNLHAIEVVFEWPLTKWLVSPAARHFCRVVADSGVLCNPAAPLLYLNANRNGAWHIPSSVRPDMKKPSSQSSRNKSTSRKRTGAKVRRSTRPGKPERRGLVEVLDILAAMPQEMFDAIKEMRRADRQGARYAARLRRERENGKKNKSRSN